MPDVVVTVTAKAGLDVCLANGLDAGGHVVLDAYVHFTPGDCHNSELSAGQDVELDIAHARELCPVCGRPFGLVHNADDVAGPGDTCSEKLTHTDSPQMAREVSAESLGADNA